MTKYASASSLWPERSSRRRRSGFSKTGMLVVGVASISVLVAAHSLADLVISPRDRVSLAVTTNAPTQAQPDASTVCWQDWPYIESGCRRPTSAAASAPVAPPVRVVSGGLQQKNTAGAAASSAGASPNGQAATNGSGVRASTVPTPAVTTPPAAAAPPATGSIAPPPAATPVLSERELTFKHGYIQRQAALGRKVDSAQARAKPPAAHKTAHAKARKDRAGVQVFQLPDGRKVVVQRQYDRQYGRYDAAQVDPFGGGGRFRSAENRAQRFGSSGERRGWFW